MSLSTLLEAAKYLDYLDSNNRQQQQQQQQQQNHQQQQLQNFQLQPPYQKLVPIQKSSRRRSSRKDAANTMLAMSLPASTSGVMNHSPNMSIGITPGKQLQGVPIPMVANASHQAASLSSSFTTGSPLSSFASTALLCSKGSSLSSSDSSLSCGEILMGDNDFNNNPPTSCPPLLMTRVQPMILNSISPSAQGGIMVFQASSPTSSSSSYSRHRELHKTLEKNRRAHLRHCFELLKAELPSSECVDKKTSHINIIKSAIRYVLALRQQECEIDNELQRLTKRKNELTESLSKIRQEQQHQTKQQEPQPPRSPTQPEQQQQDNQQPVAEQQLSFLLSQSKID